VAAGIMGLGAGARALRQLAVRRCARDAGAGERDRGAAGVVRVSENRRLAVARHGFAGSGAGAARSERADDQGRPGADALRSERRRIGVAILDSGIDGLYQFDVQYPSRTVQNLKILANGRDLVCFANLPCPGSIYVENLANSETSSDTARTCRGSPRERR